MEKLNEIPVTLTPGAVSRVLRCTEPEKVISLIEFAMPLISARAVFKVSYIEDKLEDAVLIEDTLFKSRVLRKNLDGTGRVFPYVVTIGRGLEDKINTRADLQERYYLDTIANTALMGARKHLEEHIRSRFSLDSLSFMSPGSLEDWPLNQQVPLFDLLGEVDRTIGVKLSETLRMIPAKSVSGIYFPTGVKFYNCRLCRRERCEGRKAEYDEKTAREYGISHSPYICLDS